MRESREPRSLQAEGEQPGWVRGERERENRRNKRKRVIVLDTGRRREREKESDRPGMRKTREHQ